MQYQKFDKIFQEFSKSIQHPQNKHPLLSYYSIVKLIECEYVLKKTAHKMFKKNISLLSFESL